MGEEITDSFITELKERLSSPFYGKFIIVWLLSNWKVPYVTFFVSEENIEGKNRLNSVSEYLTVNSFCDFWSIYLIPLIITAILIWIFPFITHEAYKSKEKFRKKKALEKKKVDDSINGITDKRIKQLTTEKESLERVNKTCNNSISKLRYLSIYLSNEVQLSQDVSYNKKLEVFAKKYKKLIAEDNKDKLLLLIDEYHNDRSQNYFDNLDNIDLNFLIRNKLIINKKNNYILTDFGKYIFKSRLYNKYKHLLDVSFQEYHYI